MAMLKIRKPDGSIVEIASLPGKKGDKGEKGDSPIKGVDYYTEAEKADLIATIEKELTGDIETALDGILAMQESLIGGGEV